jgi:dihydrofolate synthase/folylpolyglutamate synthase
VSNPGGTQKPDDAESADEAALAESFPTIEEALAAAEEDADPEAAERLAAAEREDAEREADLQVVLRSGLFSGHDSDVLDEVLEDEIGTPDDDADTPADPATGRGGPGADGAPASSDQGTGTPEEEALLADVTAQIISRAPEHDIQPSLDRVRDALDLLGNPQSAYPIVHLTGTNGKTSTARMVEALLRERGLTTGRFTSPHLHTIRERIAIGGEPISTPDFLTAYADIAPYVDLVDGQHTASGGKRLSFFELLTVLGYAAFADAPVDAAVIEVGLGGRWDATNVADGQVAAITPISLDHTRWLGSTLVDIANEKVGIIKDGATVVLARQPEDVEGVVLAAAAQAGARVVREGVDIEVADRELAVGGQVLTLRTPAGTYEGIHLPLHGAHQAQNALVALATVEAFFGGAALDGGVVEAAFASVRSPGRIEVVRSSPLIIVDAAHNPAGVEALREGLSEAFDLEHVVGVVGVMADKDVEAVLGELEPLLDEIVVTDAGTDRAMPAEELAEIARDVFDEDRVHLRPRLSEAIDTAAALAEANAEEVVTRTAVVVTGSAVLAGRAREVTGHTGA